MSTVSTSLEINPDQFTPAENYALNVKEFPAFRGSPVACLLFDEGRDRAAGRLDRCQEVKMHKCEEAHLTHQVFHCDLPFCVPCSEHRVKLTYDRWLKNIEGIVERAARTEHFVWIELTHEIPGRDMDAASKFVTSLSDSIHCPHWTYIAGWQQDTLHLRMLILTNNRMDWQSLWPESQLTVSMPPIYRLPHFFKLLLKPWIIEEPKEFVAQTILFEGFRRFRAHGLKRITKGNKVIRTGGLESSTDNSGESPHGPHKKGLRCSQCGKKIVESTGWLPYHAPPSQVKWYPVPEEGGYWDGDEEFDEDIGAEIELEE